MDQLQLQKLIEALAVTLKSSNLQCTMLVIVKDKTEIMRSIIVQEMNPNDIVNNLAGAISDLVTGKVALRPDEPR